MPSESASIDLRRTTTANVSLPKDSMPKDRGMPVDPNARILNLVSHWVNLLERVNTFCGAVDPSSKESSTSFESERAKLFNDLHSIREKHFADLSMLLEENRKLWKVRS